MSAQSEAALRRANVLRFERAALKERIGGEQTYADGAAELAAILSGGVPACLASARVEQVLPWIASSQPITRRRVLQIVGASETLAMRDLTGRQLAQLVAALRSPSRDLEQELEIRSFARRAA